jgi:hypothetical protein
MKTTTSKMRKSATRKNTVTNYEAVGNNIYHDGSSYRVRVSINGNKVSKNFTNKRQAVAYRNSLLA